MKQPKIFNEKNITYTTEDFKRYINKGDLLMINKYPEYWNSGNDDKGKRPLDKVTLPYRLIVEKRYICETRCVIIDDKGYGWDFGSLIKSDSIYWNESNLKYITKKDSSIIVSYY